MEIAADRESAPDTTGCNVLRYMERRTPRSHVRVMQHGDSVCHVLIDEKLCRSGCDQRPSCQCERRVSLTRRQDYRSGRHKLFPFRETTDTRSCAE